MAPWQLLAHAKLLMCNHSSRLLGDSSNAPKNKKYPLPKKKKLTEEGKEKGGEGKEGEEGMAKQISISPSRSPLLDGN